MSPQEKVDSLKHALLARLPGAEINIDPPKDQVTGFWFVDIKYGIHSLNVEYRPEGKYGLYTSEPGYYGERPNLIVSDESEAVEQIALAALKVAAN